MKNFIFGLIFAFLISVCFFLYLSNSSLNSRISTLSKKNIIVSNEDFQNLKEDYYLIQLDRDTNLLLVVFHILLAITTIATFAGVREEFKRNLAIVKNDSQNAISEYNKSVVHINNLRSSLSLQFADKINNDFGKVLLEKPLDISTLIDLGLSSCLHYCLTVSYSSNNTEEISLEVSKNITATLDVMVNRVKTLKTVKLDNFSYARFLTIKSSVDNVLDEENLKKFSIVFSKLSFSTLD